MEKAKLEIENELATLHAKMAEEKASVISSKDAERRQAVITAQDQCERDYRAFLDEHQDTLNKALKTAREEFSKEVSELERKHADEIKGYKEREAKTNHAEVHFNKVCQIFAIPNFIEIKRGKHDRIMTKRTSLNVRRTPLLSLASQTCTV